MKKRSYIDRMKPSCPSGYVPPAPLASPRAETPSGVSHLGLLPLLFPTLQVIRGRGGGLGMHLVLCPGGLPPLPLDLGPARGVGVLLGFCLLRASTLSLRWLLLGAGEGRVARSQQSFFFARSAPRLSLTIPRRTLDDVGNCGRFRRVATSFYPLVVPDLRVVVHEWIRELVHGRVVFVDRGRLSRSRSSSCCGQRSRASMAVIVAFAICL